MAAILGFGAKFFLTAVKSIDFIGAKITEA
jgi:hypothetical protein